MRLLIISSVIHYQRGDTLYAYAPYAREIGVWCRLFTEVAIAAPVRIGDPPGDCTPLPVGVSIRPQMEVGGDCLSAKLLALFCALPIMLSLVRALLSADAVQVRCPGNLGLLGVLIAPLFRRRRIAKYAGQWTAYPGEPLTFRWQRAILSSGWWRAPVIVYGTWPNQASHVIPLFNTALSEELMQRARCLRQHHGPLHVLFVGRLTRAKNAHVLLEAIRTLVNEGASVQCTIAGHGPERNSLEAYCIENGMQRDVTFTGGQTFHQIVALYERASVLVLASETEGWPKAIVEAMAFGLICIGSNRGLVPEILAEGRGIVVPPSDAAALTETLRKIAAAPDTFVEMRRRAASWAQRFTLEELTSRLHEILRMHWPDPRVGVMHLVDTLDAGGAERVAVNLVNMLPRECYRVFLGISRRAGALAGLVQRDVTQVHLHRLFTYDPLAVWRLASFIRRHEIRIVHAHGTSVFLAVASRFFTPRVTVVWHVHHGNEALDETRPMLHRLICRFVSFVVTVNRDLAAYARQRLAVPAQRVSYIANPAIPSECLSKAPDLPGVAGRRILCVANLRPEKDHLNLIRAMSIVTASVPDAHLLLVGAFADSQTVAGVKSEITKLCPGTITLLGERSDVSAIAASCDIGVLASRTEGFPVVLLEYGLSHLPVVATSVGECPEILDEGRAGCLVPPARPDVLAQRLISLLQQPGLRATLAAALYQRVQSLYAPQPVISQICHVYDLVA